MMRALVAKNIEQSFRLLNNALPDFDDDYQAFADADPLYEPPVAFHGSLTFGPVLYTDGPEINYARAEYLGFYALQQATRCLMLGINHHVGGDVLVTSDLYGPAVASYYTSAYHAIHAFLALEGRVLFDSPIWSIPSRSPAEDRRGPIIALLTRHNFWIFESRRRSHRAKWLELRQAFPSRTDDLPDAFHHLFDYMYRGVYQRGADLVDLIENRDQYRLRLSDRFEEFLIRIAETRHRSIYDSFGSDPHVVAALWNRDAFSTRGIDYQALHFGEFAGALLTHVASDIHHLIGNLDPNSDVRTTLLLSIHMPWFDDPQIDAISIPALQSMITSIKDWLNVDVAARAS